MRQDIADALGDSIFICDEGMHEPDTNKSLTHWSLEWVPRWGQYQNCDGWGDERTCMGDENFWVGHQAAEMMGAPLAGQCDANPLVGEWWSLPAGGECAPGATPGDGSCTWRATHVKTVASSCLFDARRGFVDGRACRLPSVVVRAGAPNAATTGAYSSVVREPLAGLDCTSEIGPDVRRHPML